MTKYTSCYMLLLCFIYTSNGEYRVPDEQRLYEYVIAGYEKDVRPVVNASHLLIVKFGLRLNQIVDLDERHQVLTTNVFIDQEWHDDNLEWEPTNFSDIQSLRVPAKTVWLPDTFIYNNADEGSTGFMQGTFVLIHFDGTVRWPVPVKLKSSCKVDITYFPFDDQECILRFGSWIYSGLWLDYVLMKKDSPVDVSSFVNNSEWDMLSVTYEKNIRNHPCCPEPHPDMTFTFSMRRKTFYYIFNIIVPCVMLSILTLLTFWLPPTSGEKITLGLSVFLAFSMFMLLIAEEVPATSESVPLIGIYLCVVMTMTSVSVIMAVMVINIYNRGMKTRRAPSVLRCLVLVWFSKLMCISHDIDKLAQSIVLEEEQEGIFKCEKHSAKKQNGTLSRGGYYGSQNLYPLDMSCSSQNLHQMRQSDSNLAETDVKQFVDDEVVWLRRDEARVLESSRIRDRQRPFKKDEPESPDGPPYAEIEHLKVPTRSSSLRGVMQTSFNGNDAEPHQSTFSFNPNIEEDQGECIVYRELSRRKFVVAEWQRIATVMDRILFWIYFLVTLTAYVVILFVVPGTNYSKWDAARIKQVHSIMTSQ